SRRRHTRFSRDWSSDVCSSDLDRIIVIAFALGAVFAAVGGVAYGLKYGQIDFRMGFILGLKAFTAAVLGGIGNIYGAMLGGLVRSEERRVGVVCCSGWSPVH